MYNSICHCEALAEVQQQEMYLLTSDEGIDGEYVGNVGAQSPPPNTPSPTATNSTSGTHQMTPTSSALVSSTSTGSTISTVTKSAAPIGGVGGMGRSFAR